MHVLGDFSRKRIPLPLRKGALSHCKKLVVNTLVGALVTGTKGKGELLTARTRATKQQPCVPCSARDQGSMLTSLFFSFRGNSPKRETNAAAPIIIFNAVATLVHPIESSEPATRAKGIRLIESLEMPRLLEGRPYLATVAIDILVARQSPPRQENSWRFHVDLVYNMSVSRLCGLGKESSRDARRFLQPAMAWE